MVDYTLRHTYTQGCPEVIAVARDGDQVAMALVELTGCPETLTATVTRSPDDPSGYVVRLTWDNQDEGTVNVRWDSDPLIQGQPSSGTLDKAYTEGQEGTHSVRVTDEDDPNRFIVVDFQVPIEETPSDLDLRIEPDPADPTGLSAVAIWGPTGPTPPTGELTITADPADPTGLSAVATWDMTTQEQP